jgi:hypothetical protein
VAQNSPYIDRQVAVEFNRQHGKHITHDTVAKLVEKLKKLEELLTNREVVHEHPP